MNIRNLDKNTVLAYNCKVANNFATRFTGLMGKKRLPKGNGLLIAPCNSIHMFFMKFPIDAVFLNKDDIVVYYIEGLKPWKLSKIIKKADKVLELPIETIKSSKTDIGDKLQLIISHTR